MGGMIGIASASTESMTSIYVSPTIQTAVWNLLDNGEGHYYILRYYPPGTLPCADVPNDNCESTLDTKIPPPGYIPGKSYFSKKSVSNNYFSETFTTTKDGIWVVSLWHSGSGTGGDETLIRSFKLTTKVTVLIPEFPTIIMPVAAVLGIMFFMSRRHKKE